MTMTDKESLEQVSTTSSKSLNNSNTSASEDHEVEAENNKNRTFPMFNSRRATTISIVVALVLVAGVVTISVLVTGENRSSRASSVRGSSTALEQSGSSTLPESLPPSLQPSVSPSGTPSISPSESPSSEPSLLPTSQPTTLAPTTTVAPSMIPTSTPTAMPSSSPSFSSMPSFVPSISAAPTAAFKVVDPSTRFTLRLYWKKEFMWQDDPKEAFWCWECMECEKGLNYDSLDHGAGCHDRDGDDRTCRRENQIWLQRCNGVGGSRGNAEFQLLQHDTYDVIRVANTDLCLTRVNRPPDHINRYLHIDVCSALNLQQRWSKIFDLFGEPFELRPDVNPPNDPIDKCVTQLHHPKAKEVLHMRHCTDAHGYDTGLYIAIRK